MESFMCSCSGTYFPISTAYTEFKIPNPSSGGTYSICMSGTDVVKNIANSIADLGEGAIFFPSVL